MLPIRVHLALTVLLEFAGFFVAAGLTGVLWATGVVGTQLWVVALVLLICLVIGTVVPQILMRRLIPAACQRENCQGAAFARGSKPICYVCKDCGFELDTGVSDGDGRHRWH